MNLSHLLYSIVVGVVVFLLVVLLFPYLTLPAQPWAAVLGLLAGALTYFGMPGRRV